MAVPLFNGFSMSGLSDKLKAIREKLDSVTPGMSSIGSTLGNVAGGPAMWAIQGAIQPDILPPKTPSTPQILPTQPMPPVQGLDAQPMLRPTQPMPPVQGLDLAAPSVPLPRPRPTAAPQAPSPMINPNGSISGAVGPTSVGGAPLQPQQPDTSFFMRNALMMHDPSTGQLIDPQGASTVRGPDLINKMLTYLHNKQPTGSVGNNNDPSTWGSG